MSRSVGDVPGGFDADLIADAVDVLQDTRHWRMVPARWRPVAAAIETLSASLATGDVAAFRAAVHDLELAGPVRALGFGETAPVEAPADLLEEVERIQKAMELIHSVDGHALPAPED